MKRKEPVPEKRTRRQYDEEFKASAVQMLLNGRSVSDVSRSLGVNENLLRKWKSRVPEKVVSLDQQEFERLQRYVKQLEMERDILKKALSIFSRAT